MNNGSKKSNPKKKKSSKVFLLLVVIYAISFLMPTLRSVIRHISLPDIKIGKESEPAPDYPYSDLKFLSVEAKNLTETEEWKNGSLAKEIPELSDLTLTEDYQLYQFDVRIWNDGNKASAYDGSVYVGSDYGVVEQLDRPMDVDNQIKDTRIIPPGRETIVTIYAKVRNAVPVLYVKTYNTKDFSPRSMNVILE